MIPTAMNAMYNGGSGGHGNSMGANAASSMGAQTAFGNSVSAMVDSAGGSVSGGGAGAVGAGGHSSMTNALDAFARQQPTNWYNAAAAVTASNNPGFACESFSPKYTLLTRRTSLKNYLENFAIFLNFFLKKNWIFFELKNLNFLIFLKFLEKISKKNVFSLDWKFLYSKLLHSWAKIYSTRSESF